MTAESPTRHELDPHRLAGDARSVLSCPGWVVLDVEETDRVDRIDDVALVDSSGTPVIACHPDSPLAAAAAAGRSASLRIGSGLGHRGGAERETSVLLSGRLAPQVDDAVVLLVHDVRLVRDGRAHPVPVSLFRSPEHRLNRGYLQRAADHATACHQEELRRAVSHATGTPMADLLGAGLSRLTASGVDVDWVDLHGARRSRLVFSRTARTPAELGEVLQRELHAGI